MNRFKKFVLAGMIAMSVSTTIDVPTAQAGLSPQEIVNITRAGVKGAKVVVKFIRMRRGRR